MQGACLNSPLGPVCVPTTRPALDCAVHGQRPERLASRGSGKQVDVPDADATQAGAAGSG